MSQGTTGMELEGAEYGKVVVRFPPEPSGYLHLGHAKALLMNEYFAKKYGGKLVIRFDDTNPKKEEKEYEEYILEDVKLLCDKWDKLSYTSDYFDDLYEYAIKLIKKGLAYVDDTDVDQMRKERFDGIESRRRNQSVDEALRLFEEMKNGSDIGLKSCLRAKIEMKATNKALRDPVIYRCVLENHHRTLNKWKIYPTYDFCCPIVDSIEGVTHALRTVEYMDRNQQYQWFLEAMEFRKIKIWSFSRMNFVYTLMSKRKLLYFVQNKYVEGWDDPRMPTVRGLMRRGLTKQALTDYIILQGPSQNNLLLEWDKIWAMNKRLLEPLVPRNTALAKKNLVSATIVRSDDVIKEPELKSLPKHKKNLDIGSYTYVFSRNIALEYEDVKAMTQGEEVTLMDWGNAIVDELVLNENGENVVLKLVLNLKGDFRTTKKKLTWISLEAPDKETEPINAIMKDYDHLITKPKLEENDDFESFINKESMKETEFLCDPNVKYLKKGDIIQFQRKGLFIVEREYTKEDPKPVFILIPDGKKKASEKQAEAFKPKNKTKNKPKNSNGPLIVSVGKEYSKPGNN